MASPSEPDHRDESKSVSSEGEKETEGQESQCQDLEVPGDQSRESQTLDDPDADEQSSNASNTDAQNNERRDTRPKTPDNKDPDPRSPKSPGLLAPNDSGSHNSEYDAADPSTTTSGSTLSGPKGPNFQPTTQPATQTRLDRRQQRRDARERDRERKEHESLRVQNEAVERLREQLNLGRLAICVGSGVTLYSASSQAQRLSWWGLMSNALDYFEDQGSGFASQPTNRDDLNSARRILRKDDPTEADREGVASRIQKLLGNRTDLETTWMRAQFQHLYKDYADRLELLDAIKALQEQGALLFTTNYDDLLEKHCGLEPIDASDPKGLLSYRRGSRPAVFHPHGYWRNVDHIVLSPAQYWRVKHDQVVQETLQHILDTKTVLFVGCGGGLSDPNFGPLIQWIGDRNAGTGISHYILLRGQEANPVTQLPLIHLRCEDFDDIPRFLKGLLDASERREGILSELPDGNERLRIHNWLAPSDQSGFLTDMLNLQGPQRFDRQVTRSQDVWAINSPSRVRVRGEEGWGKTMFCASVIQHTLRGCHRSTLRRARDSLAYFFCATYKPYIDSPDVQVHDFNTFLRTVISQLCPPQNVYAPLRALYTDCTKYHPARQPTNAELEATLIEILVLLEKPAPPPNQGDPIVPGETYLVIDELETVPVNMRDDYSKLINTIAKLPLQHFHLLATAEDPLTLGIGPPPRRKRRFREKQGKSHNYILSLAPQPAGKAKTVPGVTDWAEVTLDWTTTGTASTEWLRDRFGTDPSLSNYMSIRHDLVFEIHGSGQNLRWVYWKLNRLAEVGADSNLSNADLKEAAEAVLDESDDEGSDEGSEYNARGNVGGGDNDDDDLLPGSKRSRGHNNSTAKRRRRG
ncbi:hypothetical protein ANO14919_143860 [Xylariales sp. No.14919]|nr:hypothetical protein ANO14919_143860 [Xylariales sp. No.14919]